MATARRIGFHVPYTWDDATNMACTLAGLATQFGVPVSILANQAHDTGVHHRWDHLVLSSKRQTFELWQAECSHLVWFDVQQAKLETARKSGKHNILVPLWHRITQDQVEQLKYFDHIVAPHSDVYRLMADASPRAEQVNWDTGLAFTRDTMPSNAQRIFVPFDSWTLKNAGGPLLTSLRILLDSDKDAVLTVSYSRNCGPHASNALGDLLRRYPQRVRVLKKASFSDRIGAYLRHDWTFIPSLRDNAGLFAHESLCCRRPFVAFDCPPYRDLFSPDCAVFIPCERRDNWMNVPEAVPNLSAMVDRLRHLVTNPALITGLAENDWSWLESRRTQHRAKWREYWQLN